MTVFFYEETLGELEKHGHKPEEVKYVFNKDFYCSWGDFYRRATLLYHNHKDWTAFGPTLMIVGDNWWLERYNFSGFEGWSYGEVPSKDKQTYNPNIDCMGKDDDGHWVHYDCNTCPNRDRC